jgi:WD40 repeat protein
VGLDEANGIRLYHTADYSSGGTDADYRDGAYGAGFSRDSRRLVTTSFDGFIRLYDTSAGLQLLRTEKVPGDGKPMGVAFSPDGSRIAVGYGSPRVDVLAAGDLSMLFSRSVVSKSVLPCVAWSHDGAYLFAGGVYKPEILATSATTILRWNADGGDGQQFPVPATSVTVSSVTALIPLRNRQLVFGLGSSGELAIGVLDEYSNRILSRDSLIANFTAASLSASPDGLRVGFSYEILGKSTAAFSVGDRLLTPGPLPSSVVGPLTKGLKVTDWHGSASPKLDGKPLKLRQHETSLCLAIAPDKQALILGSSLYLHVFDRHGTQRWESAAPASAWGVNITRDGRTVIAAFGDGTIRWYRMQDGREILALFPHADRKRWVLWTPSGYYDASPGAEDLIGWHVNNGPDAAADFYPASRFRSIRYRPDVVDRVLSTLDEGEAVRLADVDAGRRPNTQSLTAALPPVVRIVSPSDGAAVSSKEVVLQYAVRSVSGDPVTGVRVLLDGRQLSGARRIVRVGDRPEGTLSITIPERDCEVSVIAENRNGASEAATIRLHWRGAEHAAEKPKLYILAVGISEYPSPWALHMAARDATDFVSTMKLQKNRLYDDVEVKLLTDRGATRDAILDGLEWIERSTTQHDVAMVFLAGHGDNDAHGTYYFMPVDFDLERLKRTALEFSQIKQTVQNLAGKVLLFVDSCGRGRGGPADMNGVVNELASAENGAVVFAASTGKQVALERDDWGHGAFTKALLEGLSGSADYVHKGQITVNMLDLYISERVKELTNGEQTPATAKPQTIADFAVAAK